jgi:biopolymer transport protein TolR
MQMKFKHSKKPMAEINVVPYIDVMLVLLVIFMITAPMLTQGVSVELPKAQANIIDNEAQEPIILTVDDKGEYFLNIAEHSEKAMTLEQIGVRVAAELQLDKAAGSKRLVMVKGDKAINYGAVVRAMVLLQQAGAKSVGLMTEPPADVNLAKRLTPKVERG